MSLAERAVSGLPVVLAGLRQLAGMIVLMWGVGFTPIFALMLVPARLGELKHERITGVEAERYLDNKVSSSPERRAAYERAVQYLRAKGKTRSAVVVVRGYTEPVAQTGLRRFAEAIVPTLYARQYYSEVTWDDWSGYDAYFDGTMDTYDGSTREAQLLVSFSKDPNTTFATATSEVIWYGGWEPDVASVVARRNLATEQRSWIRAAFHKIRREVVQAAYPTLCAAKMRRSWWDRLGDWASCTVSWCSGAAAGCWAGNVVDGEILWVPCFTVGCGGSEVACAVSAVLAN